jgi:hypothetical protein
MTAIEEDKSGSRTWEARWDAVYAADRAIRAALAKVRP